ncbi:heparanase-like protein 1 isoform X2 [Daucus carota subsp. sativus]|uniref:heparanase-like protein 1 isoform X2 n=1 Tax=Daucus carota subsp. sativus TaxID=79200 RepID=UPI003083DFF7
MGLFIHLFIFVVCFSTTLGKNVEHAELVVDSTVVLAETDENYICATIDWWPHDKCNYNNCPWGFSSAMNLDLNHPLLSKAVEAFKSLRIRVGGSLQDRVKYDMGNLDYTCHPFAKGDGLFGFSEGCLNMSRWDDLNNFFMKTGHKISHREWGGDWNFSNAHDFMNFTISKGYQIDSWEFGNELSGKGIGAFVGAEQYAKDIINLKAILDKLYKNFHPKPLLVAPGGFYEKEWYDKLLEVSGSNVVNVITHHIYNLGPGVDPNIVDKILNPLHLSKVSTTFSSLEQTIKKYGPWASAWVGESGGAYNSGGRHVSDTFVNSFWYLDQLGIAAEYNTKVYCRQTLIGGNYGLLNITTFVPNPDYYSALLWHQLMGKGVLSVESSASPHLRSYAHCSKERAGVTLLLINLSNQTSFKTSVQNTASRIVVTIEEISKRKKTFVHHLKEAVSWIGVKASDVYIYREEYNLTPQNGDIRSKIMLLNGDPLILTSDGDIPSLAPVHVNTSSPLSVDPLSIKFIVLPNFIAPGCK